MNKMKLSQYFTTKKRPSGVIIVIKTEDAPASVEELVWAIHKELGCSLPDDWIYREIYSAVERLEECESEDDFDRAICEIEADIYTSDLLEWAKAGWAQGIIEEGIQEFGSEGEIDGMIQSGQILAIDRIYRMVWEELKNQKTQGEEE